MHIVTIDRFQNGLETGSCACIKSTQTVQEGQRIAVANAVLAYSVEVGGKELTDLLTLACM